MKKIQNIQSLRGIAVLSVVLFHLMTIEKDYGGVETILPSFLDFGMFGVDLFFIISGFIMVTLTRGKFQNTKQALHFFYQRITRIYPTYWVYFTLFLAIFLINPSLVKSTQIDILSSFLLLPSNVPPLVKVSWTLVHEIYFYLIFFLILLFIPEKRMPLAILLWAVVVILLNYLFESSNPFSVLVSHPLTIEFIGGCFLAINFIPTKKNTSMGTGLLLTLAFIGLIFSIYGFNYYQHIYESAIPTGWWRVIIFGIPASLLVFFFINLEKNGFLIHPLLVKIGDASYSIYLSHVFVLSAGGQLWLTFQVNSIYDNIFMIPALFILIIIIGTFSYNFIEKPLLAISNRPKKSSIPTKKIHN